MICLFKYKATRNIPFRYYLPDGEFIRLYPQGQITKPLYTGCFEHEEIRLFSAFLKPRMHIIDVGANIGLYSIIACKRIREGTRIWAFEPSSGNYKRLLENLSLNRCNEFVTPVNIGLGNKDNEELCLRRDTGYGDAEKYILPNNKLPSEDSPIIKKQVESENVNLTTLDSFMMKINNPRVDFMKMDTEGYEYFGLQGARKILSLNPNMVLMLECNELGTKRAGHSQQDVYDILNEFGFCCFYWDTGLQSWGKDKESLLEADNIWACRTVEQLPTLS